MLGDLTDIDAIHKDGPIGHIIETRDQADDRRFTRTGCANKGRGLPR